MTPRFFGGVCWRWWLSPCYAVIFLTDVMSPLKPMLEKELLWDSLDLWYFYQCIRLVQCLCLYAYYRWYHFG